MIILLQKITARLIKMFGIKETSIGRLKKKLAEQQQEQKEKLEEVVGHPRART